MKSPRLAEIMPDLSTRSTSPIQRFAARMTRSEEHTTQAYFRSAVLGSEESAREGVADVVPCPPGLPFPGSWLGDRRRWDATFLRQARGRSRTDLLGAHRVPSSAGDAVSTSFLECSLHREPVRSGSPSPLGSLPPRIVLSESRTPPLESSRVGRGHSK